MEYKIYGTLLKKMILFIVGILLISSLLTFLLFRWLYYSSDVFILDRVDSRLGLFIVCIIGLIIAFLVSLIMEPKIFGYFLIKLNEEGIYVCFKSETWTFSMEEILSVRVLGSVGVLNITLKNKNEVVKIRLEAFSPLQFFSFRNVKFDQKQTVTDFVLELKEVFGKSNLRTIDKSRLFQSQEIFDIMYLKKLKNAEE
ncbi:hypothetical protein [Myroides sp. N17-2]|uniref:hypothetical protein n=1 Tax=Myroides sp. N17-2 TaxID=2030799 RepID=UPI000EFD10C3|nr:hypothetical protein [Myroides sp. N17-2]